MMQLSSNNNIKKLKLGPPNLTNGYSDERIEEFPGGHAKIAEILRVLKIRSGECGKIMTNKYLPSLQWPGRAVNVSYPYAAHSLHNY